MFTQHDGDKIALMLDGPLVAPDEEPRDEFILRNDARASPDLFNQRDSKIIFIGGRGKIFSGRSYTCVYETNIFRLFLLSITIE